MRWIDLFGSKILDVEFILQSIGKDTFTGSKDAALVGVAFWKEMIKSAASGPKEKRTPNLRRKRESIAKLLY